MSGSAQVHMRVSRKNKRENAGRKEEAPGLSGGCKPGAAGYDRWRTGINWFQDSAGRVTRLRSRSLEAVVPASVPDPHCISSMECLTVSTVRRIQIFQYPGCSTASQSVRPDVLPDAR